MTLWEQPGQPGGDANRTPNSGDLDLLAWDSEMTLKVKAMPCWMPCATEAWGSSGEALPITDEQKLITENFLMNMYPVNTLELTWEDNPLQIDSCDSPGALDDLQALRASEGAGPEEYYHCVFRQSYDSFMAGGYAWLLSDDLAEPRVSLSVNWWGPSDEMMTNVAHELGHNHGRNHPWHDDNWSPAEAGDSGCRSSWGLGIRPGPLPPQKRLTKIFVFCLTGGDRPRSTS